ncbi:hypothetical protein M8818_006223 [Zalaria obscura]|uniref:Uncharacterized protein n=1 Tax=Zalaria obscura TaxID=2024903 RepID=A0ACC3S894_9PEZI
MMASEFESEACRDDVLGGYCDFSAEGCFSLPVKVGRNENRCRNEPLLREGGVNASVHRSQILVRQRTDEDTWWLSTGFVIHAAFLELGWPLSDTLRGLAFAHRRQAIGAVHTAYIAASVFRSVARVVSILVSASPGCRSAVQDGFETQGLSAPVHPVNPPHVPISCPNRPCSIFVVPPLMSRLPPHNP